MLKIAHKDDYNAVVKTCKRASSSVAGACFNKDYDVTLCNPIEVRGSVAVSMPD